VAIELRQRDVLRGRLRFPLGCELGLFGVLPSPTSTLSRLFRRVRARKQLILADLF